MNARMLRRPRAVVPVAMSAAALAVLIAYVALNGTAQQEDEGAAAHIWQILMAGQLPVIGFFAIKWLPLERKPALQVLALQFTAAMAAIFPVWWFQW